MFCLMSGKMSWRCILINYCVRTVSSNYVQYVSAIFA